MVLVLLLLLSLLLLISTRERCTNDARSRWLVTEDRERNIPGAIHGRLVRVDIIAPKQTATPATTIAQQYFCGYRHRFRLIRSLACNCWYHTYRHQPFAGTESAYVSLPLPRTEEDILYFVQHYVPRNNTYRKNVYMYCTLIK